jgi:HK97 family phage prohead protease
VKLDASKFFQAVEGNPDLIAFTYGFGLAPEGKAAADEFSVTDETVTTLDDGDVMIEGWAANFDGLDRENENFAPGAFQRGIKAFLGSQAALCYHHKHDQPIGRVLDLKEVEGKGLYMRARVDKQETSSPLHYIYNGIKKGTIRGLSVGGFFKRKLTEAGMRIADMDFTEISVTPVPVHSGTSLAVVAGKALESAPAPAPEEETVVEEPTTGVEELAQAVEGLNELVARFESKALPNSHDPSVASDIARLLALTSKLREAGTGIRSYAEATEELDPSGTSKGQSALKNLADAVESGCVEWEAEGHRLAAKFGPLPNIAVEFTD